ncbi:putative cation/H+ exchanger, cation/H+ exchanger, CPA1 family, na+/H+ exchanger [Helianthus anomalus]
MDAHVRSLLTSSFLSASEPETEFVDQIALCAALLCGCIVVGHLLEKSRWFNQSITALLIVSARRLFPMLDIGYLEIKDYLALGAIFSATDSVCTLQMLNQEETPLLYSLVFGEGVVNDATLVVRNHKV